MKWLFIVALIISLSFGIQHIIGLINNPNYTPFALVGVSKGGSFDEAYCYVPPINAVRFGKPLADWQTFEYRNGPMVQPILGPLIFGNIAKVIGLDNLYMIVDFIFPPLIFILFYYFSKIFIKNNRIAIIISLLLLGSEALLSFITKLGISILKYHNLTYFSSYINSLNRPLAYARFDNPQFSFTILTLGLFLLWKCIHKKNWLRYLITGIILGLQWYTYSYYAIFVSLVLITASVVYFIFNNFKEIKLFLLIISSFIITSIYYFINYYHFLNSPLNEYFLQRIGREEGRWFDTSSILIMILIILIFILRTHLVKKEKEKLPFLIILLLAVFFSLNFQILSGFTIQHFHWWPRVTEPIILVAEGYLVYLAIEIVKKRKIYNKGLNNFKLNYVFLLTIFIILLAIFSRNLLIALNTYRSYSLEPKMNESFEWINKNTQRSSVIMTPSIQTNFLLLNYTHSYVFSPHSLHSLAPTKELTERMAYTFNIYGVNRNYIKNFLTYRVSPGIEPYSNTSIDLAGYFYFFYLPPESAKNVKELTEEFQTLASSKLSLSQLHKKYKLDYLFFGPSEKRISDKNLEDNSGLKKVFDNGEVKIFKVLVSDNK